MDDNSQNGKYQHHPQFYLNEYTFFKNMYFFSGKKVDSCVDPSICDHLTKLEGEKYSCYSSYWGPNLTLDPKQPSCCLSVKWEYTPTGPPNLGRNTEKL